MKKIINFILVLSTIFLIGCSTQKKTEEITFGSSMKLSYCMMINNSQLDSICNVDSLPNFKKWVSAKFTDYETNKVYFKRMYIKQYDDDYELIYILVGNEEPYKITRRIAD